MKRLIVGPWSGEFGWELFAWQAYIRSLSEHYEKTTVICRPLSHAIYADFADEYMYFDPTKATAIEDQHLVSTPLSEIPDEEMRPNAASLDEINALFRGKA